MGGREEVEDGMGFSGLVPSPRERVAEVYHDTARRVAAAREGTIRKQAAEVAALRADVERLQAALISIGILNASGPRPDPEIDRTVRTALAVEQNAGEKR